MRNPSRRAHLIFGALIVAIGLAANFASAQSPPNHAPRWQNGKVTYGIGDDIKDTNAGGIAHNSSAYPYAYCQQGVWLDNHRPNENGRLKFQFHYLSGAIESDLKNNLFVRKKKYGAPIVGGAGIGWDNAYKPKFDLNWSLLGYGKLFVTVAPEKTPYYLYRYLNFKNELTVLDPSGAKVVVAAPDTSRTKLIVFIHGWNREASEDPYDRDCYVDCDNPWVDLRENWLDKLDDEQLDWHIILYDWHVDASTGGLVYNKSSRATCEKAGWPIENATEAAEISHMHGQHLGELLLYLFPSLEKVHFLAHSAGSWAARTGARHVLLKSNVLVQVTLLDPYMPREGLNPDTALGKSVMSKLDKVDGGQDLYRLENYYSVDDGTLGTQEVFDWRGNDVNHQVYVGLLDQHDDPIQYYAESIKNDYQYGWKMSMANEELSSVGPTAAFSADPTSGDAPLVVQFTDQSTAGSTPIISWAWDFNNDGTVDSTAQDPEPPPTFEEPGTYDVKLTVYSASGSDDELKISLITVESPQVPVVTAFQINDGAASTTSRTVTLNNVCTGNPTHYMASEFADFNGAEWQTYNVAPAFELSDGVGTKTVYFKVKSGAGESGVVNDSVSLSEEYSPGDTETIMLPGNVPLEMVWIPAGSFMMGRYMNEQDSYSDQDPQHQVTLANGFWMGKYEVTKAQWQAVMNTTPWSGQGYVITDPNSPAVYISWNNVQSFITALNTHITNTGQGAATIHLPSEAQWEYACRAGTTTRFYWGDDASYTDINNYAWWLENAWNANQRYAHIVGLKLPNVWGLYDVSGNVWEWCEDWYHSSYTGAPTDGSAWISPTGSARVRRGGSWINYGADCRSANRFYVTPSSTDYNLGFRLARSQAPDAGPTTAFVASPTSGAAPLTVQFTDESVSGSAPITYWVWDLDGDTFPDSYEQNPEWTYHTPGVYNIMLYVESAVDSDARTRLGLIHVDPAEPPFITSFLINNGESATASRMVTLNNVCTGTPTHFIASESSDFSGAQWQTYNTAPSFELSAGNGVKTIYFKVKNESSESSVATDGILLDEPPLPDFSIRVSGGDSGVGWIKYDGSFNRTMNPFNTQYVVLTVNTEAVISSLELRFGEAGSWGSATDGVRPLDEVPSGDSTCFVVYGAADGELSLDNGSSWLGFADNNQAIVWPSPVSTARFRLWFPNRAQPSATSLSPYRHDPALRRRLTISATAHFEGVSTPVTKSVVIPFRFLDSQQIPGNR